MICGLVTSPNHIRSYRTEAEVNNYLQAQKCAGYSSMIVIIFFNQCLVLYTTSKMFETRLRIYHFISSVFNICVRHYLIASLAAKHHRNGTLEEVRAVRGAVTVLYPLMNHQ